MMRISLGDLRRLIFEASEPVSWKRYDFFHLSSTDLGDTFTFVPRTPRTPYKNVDDDVIEDDFTPRVSWAPSVTLALDALEANKNLRSTRRFYVYGRKTLPGEVDVAAEFGDFPTSPDNEYRGTFNLRRWKRWAEEEGLPKQAYMPPPQSVNDVPRELEHQVPDAPETHEIWATEPVTAKCIGIVNVSKGNVTYKERTGSEA